MRRADLPSLAGIEPILAWRTWTLFLTKAEELRIQPITGGRGSPWVPGEAAEASCRRPRFHRAPATGCTCGLYAARSVETLRRAIDGTVIGTVALWGRVVEHELGYRGQFAYPQRLQLLCRPCFWQWGPARAGVDLVARVSRGRLLPLCEPHLDIARRSQVRVRSLEGAARVERSLLDAYGVDPLRIADQVTVGSQEGRAAS